MDDAYYKRLRDAILQLLQAEPLRHRDLCPLIEQSYPHLIQDYLDICHHDPNYVHKQEWRHNIDRALWQLRCQDIITLRDDRYYQIHPRPL